MRSTYCLPLLLLGAVMLSSLPAQDQALSDLPLSQSGEEVLRPIPFSEQELRVIRHLGVLPTERLMELLVVYDKLNNDAMCSILVRQILKRDPENAEALRISSTLNPDEEVRPTSYLETLARSLLAGKPVHDPDGIAVQANTLLQEDRPAEAIELLEALRRINFDGQPFPYVQDLAESYQEAGQYEKAEALYQDLIQDPGVAPNVKQEAHKSMAVLAVQQRIATLRTEALRDPEAGVRSSAKLLDDHPGDPLVITFRVECLNNAGKFDQSIELLEELRERQTEGPFAYLDLLAFTHYGVKDYASARRAFSEVREGQYPEPTRLLAGQMLDAIRMDEMLERGSLALKKNDLATAKEILADLEKEFSKAPDVFAFRCLIEAKSGQSAEVLEKLHALQKEAESKGEVFKGMDTLADVHLERKEYDLSISSYESIVNNPRYDAPMRVEAARDLTFAQQQKKIAGAYREIENGDLKAAESIYAELKGESPASPEVELLAADLKLSHGKAREALSDYQRLKSLEPANNAFSGQAGIASAHHRLGEWEEALVAYDDVINSPGFEPQE
ncbi:MAG: tetratricopeptide repeat protein, partial [Roseimicrobium sp.]